ncbi:MAG: hypothetical protein AAGA10_17890 [Bacteroidota bacterium]
MKYFLLLGILWCLEGFSQPSGIYIDPELPQYWSYKGKPMMLIGGSSNDNLFQSSDFEKELDLIASVGGNYVRCTMSSRDSGNVWPFLKVGEQYDLNQFNPSYWDRFQSFLEATQKRDIIVQIECWATFDFYRENWLRNPFNPKNDKNAQNWRVRLPDSVPTHPIARENPFFWSVPKADNNTFLLAKQQRFIDKLLSISLAFDHVLYCIDNETSVTAEWALFWANYLKTQAKLQDKVVYVTEMWDPHDLMHPDHFVTIQYETHFDFVDISQNNHKRNQEHYDNGHGFKEIVYKLRGVCPLNNVKVYGRERHGNSQDGQERFWRAAFLGSASVRFHRPMSGHGISDTAQAHIQSLRWVFDAFDLHHIQPANHLLAQRESDEAYCLAHAGQSYAVYFPQGGEVLLEDSLLTGAFSLTWINATSGKRATPKKSEPGGSWLLTSPDSGHWVALLTRYTP